MSQSSPEGIILGKGSKLVSAELSINGEKVFSTVKESWNREEVTEKMWLVYRASNTIFNDEIALRAEFDYWIKENLK